LFSSLYMKIPIVYPINVLFNFENKNKIEFPISQENILKLCLSLTRRLVETKLLQNFMFWDITP
jgi:hypothetical protein